MRVIRPSVNSNSAIASLMLPSRRGYSSRNAAEWDELLAALDAFEPVGGECRIVPPLHAGPSTPDTLTGQRLCGARTTAPGGRRPEYIRSELRGLMSIKLPPRPRRATA